MPHQLFLLATTNSQAPMGDHGWSLAFTIAAVALACAIYYTANAWFTHRERMAKIEKGIAPTSQTRVSRIEVLHEQTWTDTACGWMLHIDLRDSSALVGMAVSERAITVPTLLCHQPVRGPDTRGRTGCAVSTVRKQLYRYSGEWQIHGPQSKIVAVARTLFKCVGFDDDDHRRSSLRLEGHGCP